MSTLLRSMCFYSVGNRLDMSWCCTAAAAYIASPCINDWKHQWAHLFCCKWEYSLLINQLRHTCIWLATDWQISNAGNLFDKRCNLFRSKRTVNTDDISTNSFHDSSCYCWRCTCNSTAVFTERKLTDDLYIFLCLPCCFTSVKRCQ